MSNQLQRDEVIAALVGARITAVEIDDDGGGHFDEIRITLEGTGRVLELSSWGAFGEDSYLNVHDG